MNALVTGGGGFLGGRIARMLAERGDGVTILGRSDYPELEEHGIRCLRGDIRVREAVVEACRGRDVVFHVAAKTGIWGPAAEFRSINVDGTQIVIDACRTAGVGRLVYTSTPSVVFGRQELCGVDESQPYPNRHLCHYAATKAEAEKLVLAANNANFATVVLRPHLIWGPGDPHLIPRVLERARAGRLMQVGDGKNLVDITYIDNAAEAHLLAADTLQPGAPCAGKAYFIGNERPVQLWIWINDLLERLAMAPVRRRISLTAAYRVGMLMEGIYRLLPFRHEPPMTRFVAMQLGMSHFFSLDAAGSDLGYSPRITIAEGTDRLVASLRGGSPDVSRQAIAARTGP